MDSNFSIQEKNQESKKNLNHPHTNPSRSTSVLSKKKASFSKFVTPDTSSNIKKLPKANINEIFARPAQKSSKKSLEVKTPEPKSSKVLRVKSDAKKPKQLKVNKKLPNESSPKRKASKNPKNYIEVPQYMKENSFVKKESSILLKDIKSKSKKKPQERIKYDQNMRKTEIHQYVADLNKIAREENLKKFKHEKFKPKCAWGFDEKRLGGGIASKQIKDLEAIRKKSKSDKVRSKSAEKNRTELNKSPDDHFSSKANKKKQDVKRLKPHKSKDLNKEELLKKLQREFGKSPKRNKSTKSPNKKMKKKVADISYEEKGRNIWEDSEVFEILNQGRSQTPIYENLQKNSNFGNKSSGFEPYKFKKSEEGDHSPPLIPSSAYSPYKIEDTVQPTSATLMMTEGKDLDSIIHNDDEFKELPSLDISKRKDEIKKKLNELKNKVNTKIFKESVDEEVRFSAAVKIQAFVRGWITRTALKKFGNYLAQSESWESFQPALLTENESDDSYHESEYESIRKHTVKTQVDVDYVLKTESLWRDLQREKLENLKQRDFEDLSKIAKKMGSAEVFLPYFQELLERRYENIGQIFDDHIKAIKQAVENPDDPNNLSQTDLISSLQSEEIKSEPQTVQKLGQTSSLDFKNLAFYSGSEEPSLRISELELNSEKNQALSIATISNRSKRHSHSSYEYIRTSLEISSSNINFLKPDNKQFVDLNDAEPKLPLIINDIVDICETFIYSDVFSQCFSMAWEGILCSDTFVESVVGQVFCDLMRNEMKFVEELENVGKKVIKVPELDPSKLNKGFCINDNFIKSFAVKIFDKVSEVLYDIDSALNASNLVGPMEMLNLMQESDIGVIVEKRSPYSIIPAWIGNSLNESLDKGRVSALLNTSSNYNTMQIISQKLVFDSINEILSKKYAHPHPMPWNPIQKNHTLITSKNILPILISDLTNINRLRCGKVPIIDTIINSQDSEEDLISQMREDHLSVILAMEIISQEPEWLNYEFEESQVKLDISDMALEDIVEETINLLHSFCL